MGLAAAYGVVGFSMGTMSEAAEVLRAEVEAAVLASVERLGMEGWARDAVVKQFTARGVARSTIYRWIDGIIATGKPGQHVATTVKAAAAARAAHEADPAGAAAAEIGASLPAVVTVGDIATSGAVSVIERLNQCIGVACQVIDFSRHADGKVRNSKLLLAASEHLRRNLETAAKISETMMRADRVQKFHAAIIEEISKESAELAERVAMRLARLSAQWAA